MANTYVTVEVHTTAQWHMLFVCNTGQTVICKYKSSLHAEFRVFWQKVAGCVALWEPVYTDPKIIKLCKGKSKVSQFAWAQFYLAEINQILKYDLCWVSSWKCVWKLLVFFLNQTGKTNWPPELENRWAWYSMVLKSLSFNSADTEKRPVIWRPHFHNRAEISNYSNIFTQIWKFGL